MAIVVTVMDRPSWRMNTDNIVVVLPERKKLLRVPRDLWCESLGDRIDTLTDVVPRTIEGKMVPVNRRSLPFIGWLRGLRWRRLA